MKRLLIPAVLALSLGACATGPNGGPQIDLTQVAPAVTSTLQAIDSAQVTAAVNKVQEITRQTCRFVPTVETIGRIATTFTGGGSILDIASSIADGICNAISAPPKLGRRGRAAAPRYRGVVIKGHRV